MRKEIILISAAKKKVQDFKFAVFPTKIGGYIESKEAKCKDKILTVNRTIY